MTSNIEISANVSMFIRALYILVKYDYAQDFAF